jgi:uncharacterized membrane protein YhfC
MDYSAPNLSIAFMAVVAMVGIVVPVVLLVFRKKYKADILAFFIGCAVFIVSALIIEAILYKLILSSAIGLKIHGNTWLFATYAGLTAGIFEKTGRFTAFKTILSKKAAMTVMP